MTQGNDQPGLDWKTGPEAIGAVRRPRRARSTPVIPGQHTDRRPGDFDWDIDDRVQRLTDAWDSGKTAAEIAADLGCTKDAVVGKVHRLMLSARPVPTNIAPPVVTGRRPARTLQLAPDQCRWPFGHPPDMDFRFCTAKRAKRRIYCAEHCGHAYRNP